MKNRGENRKGVGGRNEGPTLKFIMRYGNHCFK